MALILNLCESSIVPYMLGMLILPQRVKRVLVSPCLRAELGLSAFNS